MADNGMLTEDSKTAHRAGTSDDLSQSLMTQEGVLPAMSEGQAHAAHEGIVDVLPPASPRSGGSSPACVADLAKNLSPNPRGFAYCRGRLKRGLDFGFSLLDLALLLPVLLIITLVMLLTSDGPPFFGQERVGM